jgi:hypothetical protein
VIQGAASEQPYQVKLLGDFTSDSPMAGSSAPSGSSKPRNFEKEVGQVCEFLQTHRLRHYIINKQHISVILQCVLKRNAKY